MFSETIASHPQIIRGERMKGRAFFWKKTGRDREESIMFSQAEERLRS